MVPAGPLAWQSLPPRPRRAWHWGMAVALLLVVGLLASWTVQLPYYIESPGSAQSVTPLIQVDKAHGHPVKGDVMLSTVALQSTVYPLQLFAAWLDPNENIVARRDVTGGQTPTQYATQSALDMTQSEQDAIVVSLRRLGYVVPETGDGVLVTAVDPRSAATGALGAGDVIFGADGKPVSINADLTRAILAHKPGDQLSLQVENPNGTHHTTVVRLVSCPEDVPACTGTHGSRPYLGIVLQTRNDKFHFPFDIKIALSNVGGPSAGLAFALGVIDTLTTGNLTGGHKVAVTGTMGTDGTVGPIGGIALKTVAVEHAGADVFLVPRDIPGSPDLQYSAAAAKAKGHHLKVIAVGNLEDALNALRSIGGDLTGIGPAPAHLDR
jgi:PDZ domain-containing protein